MIKRNNWILYLHIIILIMSPFWPSFASETTLYTRDPGAVIIIGRLLDMASKMVVACITVR